MKVIGKLRRESGLRMANLSAMDFYRGNDKAIKGLLLKLSCYYPSVAEKARVQARAKNLEAALKAGRLEEAARIEQEELMERQVRERLNNEQLAQAQRALEIQQAERIELKRLQDEKVLQAQLRGPQDAKQHWQKARGGVKSYLAFLGSLKSVRAGSGYSLDVVSSSNGGGLVPVPGTTKVYNLQSWRSPWSIADEENPMEDFELSLECVRPGIEGALEALNLFTELRPFCGVEATDEEIYFAGAARTATVDALTELDNDASKKGIRVHKPNKRLTRKEAVADAADAIDAINTAVDELKALVETLSDLPENGREMLQEIINNMVRNANSAKDMLESVTESQGNRLGAMSLPDRLATLSEMAPQDRAVALLGMNEAIGIETLAAMNPQDAAEALMAMSAAKREACLATMTPLGKTAVLLAMSPTDRVSCLLAMSPQDQAATVAVMSAKHRAACNAEMEAEKGRRGRSGRRAGKNADDTGFGTISLQDRLVILAASSAPDRAVALLGMNESDRATTLAAMNPQDAAEALMAMSAEDRVACLANMTPLDRAAVLLAMSPTDRVSCLLAMSPQDQAATVAVMSAKDRAASNAEMEAEEARRRQQQADLIARFGPRIAEGDMAMVNTIYFNDQLMAAAAAKEEKKLQKRGPKDMSPRTRKMIEAIQSLDEELADDIAHGRKKEGIHEEIYTELNEEKPKEHKPIKMKRVRSRRPAEVTKEAPKPGPRQVPPPPPPPPPEPELRSTSWFW